MCTNFFKVCFWRIFSSNHALVIHSLQDLFCLPRPASPPVVRLLHKEGSLHAFEYGLPSTHSANAASITIFSALYFHESMSLLPMWMNVALTGAWLFYAIFLPLSRVYCGMHSFTDITFGFLVGT